jgi:hypothetical protein
MTGPLEENPEYLDFLQGMVDERLLKEADMRAHYQDFCEGMAHFDLDDTIDSEQ